ncbi:hypothetical protein [Prauserella cavernicola]|uniref:RecT-like ssDNA binding protein n=1 Tax=Prauserella cavernicola TaxID=2800127 RepID=A0A934V472_9PSEU|nr:hypothetical protein [Prauserella cavernicola]MBK1785112.1 hypothetical protein [Prauserella cavernicola]
MSTAIAPFQPDTAAVAAPAARSSALPAQAAALVEWAHSADAAMHLAKGLVSTPFCPQGFREKPYDAAAAILAGAEVGLSPLGALRSFDVIQGTAAPRAITLRAIVQSHGHQIWVEEQTSARAIVAGKRAGSDRIERSEWTIDRARGLGLHTKDNWKKQPGAMLVARATAECARLIAADAILGIAYVAEEIEDDQVERAEQEQPKRTARRRTTAEARPATRATAERVAPPARRAQAEPESANAGPPLPGEDEHADDPDPVADTTAREPVASGDDKRKVTRDQQNKLHAQLGELGITDRDDKLRVVGLLINQRLASSSDLTRAEASQVIDMLDRALGSDDPKRTLDIVLAQLEDGDDNGGAQ